MTETRLRFLEVAENSVAVDPDNFLLLSLADALLRKVAAVSLACSHEGMVVYQKPGQCGKQLALEIKEQSHAILA